MELIQELQNKFGAKNVNSIAFKTSEFLTIDIQKRSPIKVLMTKSFSDYSMPVLEKHKGKENVELCFCLPSYWDLTDTENQNMIWVFEALEKLVNHALSKNTWYGVGHTIPFSKEGDSISENMKQKFFFLNEAVFLADNFKEIDLGDKKVNFLFIVPIFEDEFDYKLGKGTYKFQKKLANKEVTELLDDYRSSVLKSKWRFIKK